MYFFAWFVKEKLSLQKTNVYRTLQVILIDVCRKCIIYNE